MIGWPFLMPCRRRSIVCCATGLMACFLVVGCGGVSKGPSRAAVSGEVTFDGEPLEAGVIRFVPTKETRGPVVFAKIREGRYVASRKDGPLVGSHRVEIDPDIEDDPAADATDLEEARAEFIRQHGPLQVVKIPDIYNRKSTLSAEIEAGESNVHDFELLTQKK